MNKLELIGKLRELTGLPKPQAQKAVDVFFGSMANALSEGDRVEIRGLCSFFVKQYEGYAGRNPKTGEKSMVAPKKLPFFKVGAELNDRVNNRSPAGSDKQ